MKKYLTAIAALAACVGVQAATIDVPMNMYQADGSAKAIGTISISESDYGLVFTPNLTGLPEAGVKGFHIHENPSCDAVEKDGKLVIAAAAGGHFDPAKTGKHLGPYDANGHLGDLPALYVNADGSATYPVLSPKIKSLDEIKNRSMMIHAGGDNHSDHPAVLGGGGPRVACGIIK